MGGERRELVSFTRNEEGYGMVWYGLIQAGSADKNLQCPQRRDHNHQVYKEDHGIQKREDYPRILQRTRRKSTPRKKKEKKKEKRKKIKKT